MSGKTIVAALAAVVLASIVHPPVDAQQVPTDGLPLAIPSFAEFTGKQTAPQR